MERLKTAVKRYGEIVFVFVFSLILFWFAAMFNTYFKEIMSVASYLTWHNLFEFISILAALSVFIVTYYTYEESGSVRMIVLGCSFLVMGILDAFHTLSYKGMADFFIPNTSSNRATTFWILSRIFGSLGILAAVIVPAGVKRKVKKRFFVIPTFVFTMVLLTVVTYYPSVIPPMFIEHQGLTCEKVLLEYLTIIFLGITFIKISREYGKFHSRQQYLFLIGLLLSIFSEAAFVSYATVYDAYNYLGHIYKIIAYFVMFQAIYTINVRMPYWEMRKAKNKLSEYSEGLNVLVEQRTKELEEINGRLLQDLEYAKEIQRSFLPVKMPYDMSVSFDAVYLPAERLSGDFYNVLRLDENNIAIFIGDVAGHGVSAAMLTIFANQNIVPIKENDVDFSEIMTPGFVVKNLYKALNKANFNNETYLVMLYGIYNTKTKCFTYASGGINVSPLYIKQTGEVVEIDVKGFAICKLGDIIMPFFDDKVLELGQGDKLLFYTDGLVEAKNAGGTPYTEEKLIELLKKNYSLDSKALSQAIKDDFFQYVGGESKLNDDLTILVMEVK